MDIDTIAIILLVVGYLFVGGMVIGAGLDEQRAKGSGGYLLLLGACIVVWPLVLALAIGHGASLRYRGRG